MTDRDLTETNVLTEASDIVFGARRAYGNPLDNHANTAAFWSNYLYRRFGNGPVMLNVRDVCLMMVLLKISRDANMPKADNLIDIAGYTLNVEVAEAEARERSGEAAQARQERNRQTTKLHVEVMLPDQSADTGFVWFKVPHVVKDLEHGMAVLETLHQTDYASRVVRLLNGNGTTVRVIFPATGGALPEGETFQGEDEAAAVPVGQPAGAAPLCLEVEGSDPPVLDAYGLTVVERAQLDAEEAAHERSHRDIGSPTDHEGYYDGPIV